ncbi:hypothetical protein [Nocardia aurantia]|uniref:Uncharacterized protein n=1 Tax=Nocardia aurantia TaxID=2585199 RepID=A0A7K0DVQ4_9NOCA|nr:hypothetical protein [Nocardia aurantia]MQY28904.1 hypothetical protein [Nocardia aurantia]
MPERPPHHRQLENSLRADFAFCFRLQRAATNARSEDEYVRLAGSVDARAQRWQQAPSQWRNRWNHLADTTSAYLHTPPAPEPTHSDADDDPFFRRNRNQARMLTGRHQATGTRPQNATTGYRVTWCDTGSSEPNTIWRTSFQTARERIVTGTRDAAGLVDARITMSHPRTGADHLLFEAHAVTGAQLHHELSAIDDTFRAPGAPPGPSWLNDATYHALVGDYEYTVAAIHEPALSDQLVENIIRRDDLRVQILLYAQAADIHNAAPTLDKIDGNPPRPSFWENQPWLDDLTAIAERHLMTVRSQGIQRHLDLGAGTEIRVGMSPVGTEPWYIDRWDYTADALDRAAQITHLGRFQTYGDLIAAIDGPDGVAAHARVHQPLGNIDLPPELRTALAEFDYETNHLVRVVQAAHSLRATIRDQSPYLLSSDRTAIARTATQRQPPPRPDPPGTTGPGLSHSAGSAPLQRRQQARRQPPPCSRARRM